MAISKPQTKNTRNTGDLTKTKDCSLVFLFFEKNCDILR